MLSAVISKYYFNKERVEKLVEPMISSQEKNIDFSKIYFDNIFVIWKYSSYDIIKIFLDRKDITFDPYLCICPSRHTLECKTYCTLTHIPLYNYNYDVLKKYFGDNVCCIFDDFVAINISNLRNFDTEYNKIGEPMTGTHYDKNCTHVKYYRSKPEFCFDVIIIKKVYKTGSKYQVSLERKSTDVCYQEYCDFLRSANFSKSAKFIYPLNKK